MLTPVRSKLPKDCEVQGTPKKSQTNSKRKRGDAHRSSIKYVKIGSFNIAGVIPPTKKDGARIQGEYSGKLLEAIEYAKNAKMDCLALQETYEMEDAMYRTAHGWTFFGAGEGMGNGVRSGVAIVVPPHRMSYLKNVIVPSYRIMAAIFNVTGGELAIITYHAPWDLKNYRTDSAAKKKQHDDDTQLIVESKQAEHFFKDLHELDMSWTRSLVPIV